MILTPRVKESIKTSLAITIAYGIALSMDWDRPYWAGFAVAFISLSTIGQSLNKGLHMLGTLLALTMSLLIIGLFVQDRWWFMMALSGWIGFCTYRMGVSRHSYFWFLAGFASATRALVKAQHQLYLSFEHKPRHSRRLLAGIHKHVWIPDKRTRG